MGTALIFDISGGELLVILLFALLFFGSKGIPDLARTLGRTMRQVRDASNEVQREIQRGATDVTRAVNEQRRSFQQTIEAEQSRTPSIPPHPVERRSPPSTHPHQRPRGHYSRLMHPKRVLFRSVPPCMDRGVLE